MHYQHVTESERGKILAGMEADGEAAMEHMETVQEGHPETAEDGDELETLAQTLENMAPAVRAAVLRNLSPSKSSSIISTFSPDIQTEIMTRLLEEATS